MGIRVASRDPGSLAGMRHLVWDWNGTLLDDFPLVIEATNVSLASVGGPVVTADEHRRTFRRPLIEYYADLLGRPVDLVEFEHLDRTFHDWYRTGLFGCELAADALVALGAWSGTQSVLSMWSHAELVPELARRGLTGWLTRIDGRQGYALGDLKATYLKRHLAALGLDGADCVLVGDSVDDADAAAAVGAACVLYAGGFTDIARLRDNGVPVVTTLVDAVALAASRPGPVGAAPAGPNSD